MFRSKSKVAPGGEAEAGPPAEGRISHDAGSSGYLEVPVGLGNEEKASPPGRRSTKRSEDRPSDEHSDVGSGGCTICCGGGKAAEKGSRRRRFCACPKRTFTDFMQQRMHAWQPVLSPQRIVGIIGLSGLVLLALGVLILVTSNRIIECKVDYTNAPVKDAVVKIGPEHCTDSSIEELSGQLYFFYELSNFYQNHRRYLKSRSDPQLQGKVYTQPSEVKTACDPRYVADDGRVLDPCGLNAMAVFTDSFSLVRIKDDEREEEETVPLDETRETICWHFDLNSRFKNPSEAERKAAAGSVDFWLFSERMRKALHMDKPGVGEGVENSHFIVWMREAALPKFRKIYGKIDESPLKLPVYVKIPENSYDVKSFGGKKYVVISQASWLGGRNSFLGIAYLVVASVCLVVCVILLYAHMRNPRHMGDISWLRKALYADA